MSVLRTSSLLRHHAALARFVGRLDSHSRSLASLALLEQKNGKLQEASLGAITAAKQVGGPVTAMIAGSGVKALAAEVAKVKGLDKILFIENEAYEKVWESAFLWSCNLIVTGFT